MAWTVKTGEFITLVLRKLGAVAAGETASAEDFADAKRLIEATLKSLHSDGVMWWAVKTADVAFTSATASRPSDCVECVAASWLGEPVRRIGRIEYERIQDKAEPGYPATVFDDGTNLNIWPVGTGNLRLTYLREILDTDQGVAMDMPIAVVRPMIDLMAFELEPWFDVPQSKQARIISDGQAARVKLRSLANVGVDHGITEAEYF